jgi:hypothetical protein
MTCMYCGTPNDEYYMLHDELWSSIAPSDDDLMCLTCAEDRLGRPLAPDDFLFTPAELMVSMWMPPPVHEARDTALGKDKTDHRLCEELAGRNLIERVAEHGKQTLDEFYDRLLERAGGECRSVPEWLRRVEEEHAAHLARLRQAEARRQNWIQPELFSCDHGT